MMLPVAEPFDVWRQRSDFVGDLAQISRARAVFAAATEAIRNPITTNSAGALEALQATYGDKTTENLALAKAQISTIAKTWPGVYSFLDRTGLGNSPEFIRQIINRAKR